ncbi:uncharacterized protein LOC131738178 [Acipenser ruthenus]|uniref:uncharacterized protein LOC131738178 n=1 Tax=Acipenser ruthenus TaxID=7906 RepID=UPI00274137A7|nr:uncharacterized protein LOC131738178 [Acipenser ruthenus]
MIRPIEVETLAPTALNENGLAMMVEKVRLSISRDINGADLLFSLLKAPWLQSLLKVYTCLQQYLTRSPTPFLPSASALSQEVISDLRTASPFPEVKELHRLLRNPHMQALLFAHDMVAQKDYEPILLPLPDNLSDEEEAMRIMCLVKNKQTLKNFSGIKKRLDDLKRRTKEKLARKPAGRSSREAAFFSVPTMSSRRQAAGLGEDGMNLSAPSLHTSVLMDYIAAESASNTEAGPFSSQPREKLEILSLRSLEVPASSSTRFFQNTVPTELPYISRRPQTVPSRPLLYSKRDTKLLGTHRTQALSDQESLEELRSTMKSVASTVDKTSRDVQLLGEMVVAATELMSETMQENTQTLNLLMNVLERIQGLLLSPKSPQSARSDLSARSAAGSFSEFMEGVSCHPPTALPSSLEDRPEQCCLAVAGTTPPNGTQRSGAEQRRAGLLVKKKKILVLGC